MLLDPPIQDSLIVEDEDDGEGTEAEAQRLAMAAELESHLKR